MMYIPSSVMVGPVSLTSFLTIVAIITAMGLLNRLKAPERITNTLWIGVMSAFLAMKIIYMILDPHYYLTNPRALLFTPQSALGQEALLTGASLAWIVAIIHYRPQWTKNDGRFLIPVIPWVLFVMAWGTNLFGISSDLPLLSVASLHRLASYAVWGILMFVVFILLWTFEKRGIALSSLLGLFFMMISTSWLLVSITLATRGHPFTPAQWLSLIGTIVGYRLLSPHQSDKM